MSATTGQIDRAIAHYRRRVDRGIRSARRDVIRVRWAAFEAIITSVYEGASRVRGECTVTVCFLDRLRDVKSLRSQLLLQERYEELDVQRDGYHYIRIELKRHLSEEGLYKLKRMKELGYKKIHLASRTVNGTLSGFRFRAKVT